MSTVAAQRYAAYADTEYRKSAHLVAERLRGLADKIETLAEDSKSPLSAASSIVHDIMWELANTNLAGLIRRAAEAEKALAEAASSGEGS